MRETLKLMLRHQATKNQTNMGEGYRPCQDLRRQLAAPTKILLDTVASFSSSISDPAGTSSTE
ncbi:hypothetical protein PtA15_4A383 [Puccinia triticina]|uniref:Uncharacterized protein n=1 Tax=Puccinia triticina TaxID=208348 RepID=A0ABY7CFF8_9BASI|nr:uncharacterized protein PtA15_4A383 [Puccinia triticina]WAQ83933.1 hypothetical protein PtA15_4A383 [Puccinia triticina]